MCKLCLHGILAFVIVALVICFGVFFNAVYVGYALLHPHLLFMWTVRLLRKVVGVVISILYIPLLEALVSVLPCKLGDEPPRVQVACSAGKTYTWCWDCWWCCSWPSSSPWRSWRR